MEDIKYSVENGYIYFDLFDQIIYYCDDNAIAADIPPEINGISVCEISDHAFAFNSKLKKITIPSTVNSIGDDAFLSCTALERIDVDKNNTHYMSIDGILYARTYSIDDNGKCISDGKKSLVACGCGYKAREAAVADGTSYIEFNAFRECINIESIILPESLKFFSPRAFADCKSLKNINIPEGISEIPAGAFAGCISLEKIVLPESVRKISDAAFWGCTSLESIEIKNEKAFINPTAFRNCRSLKNMSKIKRMIGENAVYYNNPLEKMLDSLCEVL